MTYYELKAIRKSIDVQKLKVAVLREKSVSLSSAADDMPHISGTHDRVGTDVDSVIIEEERLNGLYTRLTESIKAIPDEYIRTLIHCKLMKQWSWTRIAQEIGGGNTKDSVRMTAIRYHW